VDPGALFEELSPGLLYEWMAFDQLEPFGGLVSWWQSARLMAFQANTHPFRKKYSKDHTMDEFMPTFEPTRQKSPTEIYALFRTWAVLSGAKKSPAQ